MKNAVRFLAILALIVGFVMVAGQKAAWASQPPLSDGSGTGPATSLTVGEYEQVGSVNVPTDSVVLTEAGPLVLGGCVTGSVTYIPAGGRLRASLLKSWGNLPALQTGAGKFYRCLANLNYQENATVAGNGHASICFAVPPKATGSIYFLDKSNVNHTTWVRTAGPFTSGVACGPADRTGIYGLVIQ